MNIDTWIETAAGAALLAAATVGRGELNYAYVELDDAYVAYERDVGDIDGDGLGDIAAVSDGGTTVEWFRAPEWERRTLVTFSGAYRYTRADDMHLADVDGDGDRDLVVRLGADPSDDGEGRAAWVENLGGGTGWVTRLVGTSPGYVKDIAVVDFDRDGRLDLALRQDSLTQIWFQETDGWTEVRLSHPPHEGMETGDLDMDGDPDLVLNGFWFATPDSSAAARVAANYTQRTIDAAWFNQTGDWTANSCRVEVGDIDGNGTNDVVLSHSERDGYAVTWYSPAPDGGSWTAHPVATIGFCHNLKVADFDLDGDLDILAGGMPQSSQRGLRLLLNAGGGTAWTTTTLQSDGSYSVVVGDLDDDGDTDIVGIRNWNAAPTYIYRSNAAGPPSLDFWHYVRVTSAHERTFGLAFLDADADGDVDIASGQYLYRNPGGALTGAWQQATIDAGIHAFLAPDVNGDNRTDLLALRDNAAANRIDLYWYEAADAGATAWSRRTRIGDVPRGEHAQGFQGYRLAQLVADGKPEVVVSTAQGLYYFVIPGTAPETGAWPRVFIAANDSDEGIGAADLDDDGYIDVTFTRGGDKAVRWARNPGDGSGNWEIFTVGSFPEANWPDRCEAADLDGDGRADIVVTEENSGGAADALACWWRQPASSPTNGNWARHTITTRYTMNSLDTADMDRDGDTDLVIAEHQGPRRIAVFANDGTGTFTEHPVGTGNENHLGARAVDLDGDGDLDLAGIAYFDFTNLHVWRNDSPAGTPAVARPVITPNGGTFDEPWDVILACSTPDAAIWYTLDGSPPTNRPPASAYSGRAIRIDAVTVLRARGYKEGLRPSPLVEAVFTGPKVRQPVIAPPGGTFDASVDVAVSCQTAGATIRVTTNDVAPDERAPVYNGPFTLTASATVRARAWRAGLTPSDEVAAVFTRFSRGAVAHWRLDERFGAVAADSAGGAHDGTVVGATWAPGRFDNALAFDGVDDRVETGAWDVGGTGLTVCAWARLDPAFVDNDARILSKAGGPAEQDHDWMLSTTTDGGSRRLRFRLKTGGATSTLIASSGILDTGVWRHVGATYDGATMRLYLDGAEVGSQAKRGMIDAAPGVAVWLGANPPNAYAAFKGLLDDVRVYNVSLTPAQLAGVIAGPPAAARPAIKKLKRQAAGVWSIEADSMPGHYYVLERAQALVEASWAPVITQANGGYTLSIPAAPDAPESFFRLVRD